MKTAGLDPPIDCWSKRQRTIKAKKKKPVVYVLKERAIETRWRRVEQGRDLDKNRLSNGSNGTIEKPHLSNRRDKASSARIGNAKASPHATHFQTPNMKHPTRQNYHQQQQKATTTQTTQSTQASAFCHNAVVAASRHNAAGAASSHNAAGCVLSRRREEDAGLGSRPYTWQPLAPVRSAPPVLRYDSLGHVPFHDPWPYRPDRLQ